MLARVVSMSMLLLVLAAVAPAAGMGSTGNLAAQSVGENPRAEAAAQLARDDLAARLGVSPDDVAVVAVEATDWPDTSLGCPRPEMAYAQIITPGYQVLLEYGGRRFDYRTAGTRRAALCGETIGGVAIQLDLDAGTLVLESARDGALTQVSVTPEARLMFSDGGRAEFGDVSPETKVIAIGEFAEDGSFTARQLILLR